MTAGGDSFDDLAREIVEDTHRHECAEWKQSGTCEIVWPCKCECGAQLAMGPTYKTDGRWMWKNPDGTMDPFPDVRDSEAQEGRSDY